MYFKHPEILYALFALIIPILIHLFQLQKFEKVKFTNVKLLKEIEQENRKSSKLKKWLILVTRLLLLTSIIFAFAQPYLGKNTPLINNEYIIYLDNSLSMQAKGKNGELLKIAIQDIIESFQHKNQKITLFTNNKTYKEIRADNKLLDIDYYPKQKNLHSILLQAKSLQKNKNNKIILISDFQKYASNFNAFNNDSISLHLVQLLPEKTDNIAIDSVWISEKNNENITLKVKIKNYNSNKKNSNLSLFINRELKGKSSINFDKNNSVETEFILQNKGELSGYVSLDNSDLLYDNTKYFVIQKNDKTKVLAIGENNNFLSKIYHTNEFTFEQAELNQLDVVSILNQNLVILNQLDHLPNYLINTLQTFLNKGGNLVIIPSHNLNILSYNSLFSTLQIGKIKGKTEIDKLITNINYEHPFFKNVFKKQIKNYQYPIVHQYFNTSFPNASNILSLENGDMFISEIKVKDAKVYWIASPLSKKETNFTDSPLVIPVFINFALQDDTHQQLYFEIGSINKITVPTKIQKDQVVHIAKEDFNFIPLQISKTDKVILTTEYQPIKSGIYQVIVKNDTLKKIAFNFKNSESNLNYASINTKSKPNIHYSNSVKNLFTKLNEQNKSKNLWQLFLIFALIFLIIEILLEKLLKNQ